MYKNDKVIRRYSESFKLKILDELTTRKLNKYQLGKPVKNSLVERFNKSYRQEVLNAYLFQSLSQVRALTEQWLNITMKKGHVRPYRN